MRLSVLILTHNRPKLFERCLTAVLKQIPADVEIIVNNDSNDITVIDHPQVTYYFNQFDNLSAVYKFLLNASTGEYVYYAEDDDYVVSDLLSIALDADIVAGNYYPKHLHGDILTCTALYNDDTCDAATFLEKTDFHNLQLSQYFFKRSVINEFTFPEDSDIHNDMLLVRHAATQASCVRTSRKVFFYQTTDNKDNISFPNIGAVHD